jgi:hypothetical protein
VTVIVAVAPLANEAGRVQLMVVVVVQVVPALGTTEIRDRFVAAQVSVSVTLLAADNPLLKIVMSKTEFCPRATALTLVVTPISAVVGLIYTAPSDQFDVPLNVSEIGTLGAPVRVLAVPFTPGFVFPCGTFHA